MGRIDRRIARLESTYQSGDEWPPELLAAAFERVSDQDLAVIESYCFPNGFLNPSSLGDEGWEQEPNEDEAEAIGRLMEFVEDIRDEWGL
jgi:hypothetical protein